MNTLGLLGFLPFAAGAWLIVSGDSFLSIDPRSLFSSYSAIILSFLGGVLWGRGLTLAQTGLRNCLLLLSNIFALIAWFTLLLAAPGSGLTLIVLMLGYVAVYGAERSLGKLTFQDQDSTASEPGSRSESMAERHAAYTRLRSLLTSLVVGAHLVVLLPL